MDFDRVMRLRNSCLATYSKAIVTFYAVFDDVSKNNEI